MMINTEAKILKTTIEVKNNDTGEIQYFYVDDNEWLEISKDEYNKIVGGFDGE